MKSIFGFFQMGVLRVFLDKGSKFSYDGTYCLRYGAENEEYYRIIPNGSAFNMFE